MDAIRAVFEAVASLVQSELRGGETFTASLAAERSDFVRFSRGKLGQSGCVEQAALSLRLVDAGRHATLTLQLAAKAGIEGSREAVRAALAELRAHVAAVPPDPYLLLPEEAVSSERIAHAALPSGPDVVFELVSRDDGDRVGLYAGGTLARGFASSTGQRNWFESSSFALDYSLVHENGRAVKTSYGGTSYSAAALAAVDARALRDLAVLGRPAKRLDPGDYRAYLAPAALEEVFSLLAWEAFAEAAHRTRATPLLPLFDGRELLSPHFTLREHVVGGIAPNFSPDGFPRPDSIALVEAGRHAGTLVSARSAREFGAEHNGADGGESPDSLSLDPGTLAERDVLARLGTGVHVANLWYLNYSDMPAGRMTGMTRFATFWVENGEVVAPIDAMRFDDSLYSMFGAALEDLTAERELRPSRDTYVQRSTSSVHVPGALVSRLRFTL